MAKPYFRQVPNFEYVSRDKDEQQISNYKPVKNLFKRGKLREDIFGNLGFFEKYSIIGDERPDNVAYKFYGDETLDWVVLLSNNILDVYNEWPLTQTSFDKVMLQKYGTYENLYSGIHHYETSSIKNSLGATILQAGIRVNPTWKTNGNFVEFTSSNIFSIGIDDSDSPKTVTVQMENFVPELYKTYIPNLKVGDEIVITGVNETIYNGRFSVTSITTNSITDEDGTEFVYVYAFTYELSTEPDVTFVTLSGTEKVLFTIPDVKAPDPNSYILSSSYYYEYYDQDLGYSVVVPSSSFVVPVTNYEYESKLEEEKRNIFVLKPIYLNVIFNDLDDIMPYKQGGSQYVNSTLKRGDNIRLYE